MSLEAFSMHKSRFQCTTRCFWVMRENVTSIRIIRTSRAKSDQNLANGFQRVKWWKPQYLWKHLSAWWDEEDEIAKTKTKDLVSCPVSTTLRKNKTSEPSFGVEKESSNNLFSQRYYYYIIWIWPITYSKIFTNIHPDVFQTFSSKIVKLERRFLQTGL